MVAVLNMARQLLDVGRHQASAGQVGDAVHTLQRLIHLPEVPPNTAAEAQRLLAEMHFRRGDFADASEVLESALSAGPLDGRAHYMLGRKAEHDGEIRVALDHYHQADRLAGDDYHLQAECAARLVRIGHPAEGIERLESLYTDYAHDPVVIRHLVESQLRLGMGDQAELVLAQSTLRYGDEPDFRRLRQHLLGLIRQFRLERGLEEPAAEEESDFLSFPSFAVQKQTGNRRPVGREEATEAVVRRIPFASPSAPAFRVGGGMPLADNLTLDQTLKLLGSGYVASLYDNLGLLGQDGPAEQVREIATALLERNFLRSLVRRLPADSQRLLTAVVAAGGYMPASVLFQNVGPDAPAPAHAQPLLREGLLYLGQDPDNPTKVVAMVPLDLLERLESVVLKASERKRV